MALAAAAICWDENAEGKADDMPIPIPIPMNGFMREWEARRSVRSCRVAFWDTGGTGIVSGRVGVSITPVNWN
jgi:hypothetical protein